MSKREELFENAAKLRLNLAPQRGSGRTARMLNEALDAIDLLPGTVVRVAIFCTQNTRSMVVHRLIEMATARGGRVEAQVPGWGRLSDLSVTWHNGKSALFKICPELPLGVSADMEFSDHFLGEPRRTSSTASERAMSVDDAIQRSRRPAKGPSDNPR